MSAYTRQSFSEFCKPLMQQLWLQLRFVVQRFMQNDCLTIAGSLTFTSMLALVPLMTVVYVGLAFLPEYAALAGRVEDFIFQNFVPSSSSQIQQKLSEFIGRAEGLTTFGLTGLALSSLMLLLRIERHFNAIWQVAMPRWDLRRTMGFLGLLTLGPSLVLTGLWVSTYLLSMPFLAEVDLLGVTPFILGQLPTLCLFLVFSILFKFVPNTPVRLTHAFVGGVITSIVFKLAFAGFAQLSSYAAYDAIYGTLAVLPAFLVWLFLVWVIVLLGAVLVCSLPLKSRR